LCGDGAEKHVDAETLRLKVSIPNAERIFYLAQAFQDGMSVDEVFELSRIDRWFLRNVQQIVEEAAELGRGTGFQSVGQAGVSRATDSAGRMPTGPTDERSVPRFRAFDPEGEIVQTKRQLP
jgi:carbamoyl-phosphate synthase large subunit